jgi:hypothetical protein
MMITDRHIVFQDNVCNGPTIVDRLCLETPRKHFEKLFVVNMTQV